MTDRNITTKTGSRSITPLNVGYAIDSALVLIKAAYAAISAAGDLQAVTTLGNTTNQHIYISDAASRVFNTTNTLNGAYGQLQPNAVILNPAGSSYFGAVSAGAVTANRTILIPNEGDGSGLDAWVMLHTSAYDFTCTNGTFTNEYGQIVSLDDGAGNNELIEPGVITVRNTSGTEVNKVLYKTDMLEYVYTNSVGSVAHSSALRFDRTYAGVTTSAIWFPNLHDGDTLATLGDIYNNGVSVAAYSRLTARTAAVASVTAYTVGVVDSSFEVSANVNVTTSTTHSFNVQCDYTDETNTARTLNLVFNDLSGTLVPQIADASGAIPYSGIPHRIRCKASTVITIKTTGIFTAVTYNIEGIIKRAQ
jgi:hypothetical protein